MSRKLASIRRINRLEPIPGKDRIELAFIDGWQVIVKKGEFEVGSKCVYIEIDSVLPPKPEFEFLKSKNYRIKTMKMSGVLSEGICFPMSILPKPEFDYTVDQDVTDIIGVKQYQATMDDGDTGTQSYKQENKKWPWWLMKYKWFRQLVTPKKTRGFPSFVQKTDECRIQGSPWILDNKKISWDITEKVDGCLVGQTCITTDQGSIPISTIVNQKMPVHVLTYNKELNVCEFKHITDYHKIKNTREHYKIGVAFRGHGNRQKFIECTDNHKFLTNMGWKRADELLIDDKLLHYSNVYPSEIEDIIIGCILGDSSLNANSGTGSYRTIAFSQSDKQVEYYNYKKQLFGSLFIDQGVRTSGYGSTIHYGMLSSNLQVWSILNKYFEKTGKKYVSKELANSISPISLAFWYMDDGTLRNRDDDHLRCRAMLCTNRYSYEENLILQEALKIKFNIDTTIGDKDTYKGYVLIFDADNTDKLCQLVAPYICKSMKYKLPKKYENMPCVYENFSLNYTNGIVQTDILSIECLGTTNDQYVYDLEVADNHNYFAKNILVHNCSATYALVKHKSIIPFCKTKYEFIVCSRNNRLGSIPDNTSYWSVVKKYEVEKVLRRIIDSWDWVCIQGECIGPKVQGNKYKRNDYDLYVFNVIFGRGGERFRLPSTKGKVLMEANGLNFVPILETGVILPDTVDEMLKMAHGQSVIGDTLREGLVCRSTDGKQSFKAVDPEFLMHYDE